MAIRAAGSYVSKSKGAKKKSRGKENRFNKNKFYNLTSRCFPVTYHGTTSHPKVRSRQDLNQYLIGRTFSVNQGDLECKDPLQAHNSIRNFKFKVNGVKGNDCVSVFNGMEVSRDKLVGMIRKWHTLIESNVEITSKDGSVWRVFVNAVTRKRDSSAIRHYAKASEVKSIRKEIVSVLTAQLDNIDVEKMVKILSTDNLVKEIETKVAPIYPVNAMVTKVKAVKNMQCIVMKHKAEEAKESTFDKGEESD